MSAIVLLIGEILSVIANSMKIYEFIERFVLKNETYIKKHLLALVPTGVNKFMQSLVLKRWHFKKTPSCNLRLREIHETPVPA